MLRCHCFVWCIENGRQGAGSRDIRRNTELLNSVRAVAERSVRHFAWPKLITAWLLSLLSACSVHPIPDEVSPLRTEEIVRSARCEMRLGLFDQVGRILRSAGVTDIDVRDLQTREGRQKIGRNPPPVIAGILADYGAVAVAYDFFFEITENDNLTANMGFRIPYLSPSAFDLGLAGNLNKTRVGKRAFSTQETFKDLILRNDWCDGFEPLDRNIVYPITGSIGLRKAVGTFMAIAEQGGGKDSFVDTLTFTTTIGGSVSPSVKLNPVPHSFRVVSAGGSLSAGRTDMHKVTISLAFPVPVAPAKPKKGITTLERIDPNETGPPPFTYNPVWRARYNICVADARDREDALKILRLSPPEVYCIEYADTFVPRTTADAAVVPSGIRRGTDERAKPRSGAPPERGTPTPPAPQRPRTPSWW